MPVISNLYTYRFQISEILQIQTKGRVKTDLGLKILLRFRRTELTGFETDFHLNLEEDALSLLHTLFERPFTEFNHILIEQTKTLASAFNFKYGIWTVEEFILSLVKFMREALINFDFACLYIPPEFCYLEDLVRQVQ